MTVILKESVNALDAVVITAGTFEAGDKARVSVLKPLDIVTTAGAAGDIIGALTTLPGAQTVGESGRLFVRGGEANETQTFVDGMRVAQPYGATANNTPTRSRFSPFLFSGVSFSTGGYSAEYGNCPGNYSVTRTWTATDDCGNSSTATQTINVRDITAPVIVCSANISQCYDGNNCFDLTEPTAFDECGNVEISRDPILTCYQVGTTIVTWTATDDCGNQSTCEQLITIYPELLVNVIGAISCIDQTASVTVTANGGTPPYIGTGIFTDVPPGAHTFIVTHHSGCTASATITIELPTPMAIEILKTDAICYNGQGTATAIVYGGSPPYSYEWNSDPIQFGATAYLNVGHWSVTVSDANGCTATADIEINLNSCPGFTTATQGGWGAARSGGNWGCYRNNNFANAFPTGLIIGMGDRTLKLTTAAAVDAFLPSSTTARPLNPGHLVNPGSTYKNILAGQAVALTLNIGFDNYDPNFSSSTTSLGSLIVSSGIFQGWTVNNLLLEANKILGGLGSAYTPAEINNILNLINKNYDNGTQNLNLLACPCPSFAIILSNEQNEIITKDIIEFESYPNPFNYSCNVHFKTNDSGKVKLLLYNLSGQLVRSIYDGVSDTNKDYYFEISSDNLENGIYMLVLRTGHSSKILKIILSN